MVHRVQNIEFSVKWRQSYRQNTSDKMVISGQRCLLGETTQVEKNNSKQIIEIIKSTEQ